MINHADTKSAGGIALRVRTQRERTEHEYFVGWKCAIGNKGLVLKPLYVKSGGNALGATEEAVKAAKADKTYDDFWCICDVDDTPAAQLNDARALAAKNQIKLCLSNRCFEVWIALHWGNISTSPVLSEEQAIQLFSRHYPKYTKKSKSVPFNILIPLTNTACQNAKALRKQALDNPYTDVHILVSELKEILN